MMLTPNSQASSYFGNQAQESDIVGTSSSSESGECDSENDRDIQTMVKAEFKPLVQHRIGQRFSYPVFDMRHGHRKIEKQVFKNFKNSTASEEELKNEVAKEFETDVMNVEIHTEPGTREETREKTIIFILPVDLENRLILLIKVYGENTAAKDNLRCISVSNNETVNTLAQAAKFALEMKAIELCKDRRVLNGNDSIGECGFKNFGRIQVVEQIARNLKFLYVPTAGAKFEFTLEINNCLSVKNLRKKFISKFGRHIVLKSNETVHFLSRKRLLSDTECIGLVMKPGIDFTLNVQIGPPDAICITLKSRSERGKPKLATTVTLVISPTCSTGELRVEAAKRLKVDPKAVKLIIDGKRVDEFADVQEAHRLNHGTVVVAGIKKKKNLCMKHPINQREVSMQLFMLEPVHVLKQKCAEQFGIDKEHIMLWCRNIEMKDNDLLQNYPLKNDMELRMELYENRLRLNVNIIFKKTKLCVIVDDREKTTVDDLLVFCALKNGYDRACSKCICQERCLYKGNTLKQEGLESGRNLYIVEFPQEDVCRGGMTRIFEASSDGKIEESFGVVQNGMILRAHPDVKLPVSSADDKQSPQVKVHLPDGIHLLDSSTGDTGQQKQSSSTKRSINKTRKGTKSIDKDQIYQHFLYKANEARKRIRDESQRESICSSCSSQTYLKTPMRKQMKDSQADVKFYNPGASSDNLSSVRNSSGPWSDDCGLESDSHRLRKSVSFSDGNGQECVSLMDDESDTSSETSLDENQSVAVRSASSMARSSSRTSNTERHQQPFDDIGPLFQLCLEWHRKRWQKRRRRTTGDLPLSSVAGLGDMLVPSRPNSCPVLRMFGSYNDLQNADLNTSGITRNLLTFVAMGLGGKWKKLARCLDLSEPTITSLEHEHKGLEEVSFQALVAWKRNKGREASRELLLGALNDIGMKSLAEDCEEHTKGYHTT